MCRHTSRRSTRRHKLLTNLTAAEVNHRRCVPQWRPRGHRDSIAVARSRDIAERHSQSTHGVGVCDALRLAERLGRLPDAVEIFGIEVAECEPGREICLEVLRAVAELEAVIAGRNLRGGICMNDRWSEHCCGRCNRWRTRIRRAGSVSIRVRIGEFSGVEPELLASAYRRPHTGYAALRCELEVGAQCRWKRFATNVAANFELSDLISNVTNAEACN